MRWIRIIGLCVLYVVLSAKGCDEGEKGGAVDEAAALESSRDSILEGFRSEILSESSLRAFEEKAKQALMDFTDYFRILYDTSMDTSFRNQAGKMIKGLFVNEKTLLFLASTGSQGSGSITVKDVLMGRLFPGYSRPELIFDSIRVYKGLTYDGISGYTGELSLLQGYTGRRGTDSVFTVPESRKAIFYLRKHSKLFGTDTLEVWVVLLGEIDRQ